MIYSGTDNTDVQLFFRAGTNELRTSVENIEKPTSFVLSSSNINQWHHIIWTYDYVNDKVWVDGNLVLNTPQSTALTINDANVNIGAVGGGGNYWLGGVLDDIRIYNRALSTAEVQQLYLMGK